MDNQEFGEPGDIVESYLKKEREMLVQHEELSKKNEEEDEDFNFKLNQVTKEDTKIRKIPLWLRGLELFTILIYIICSIYHIESISPIEKTSYFNDRILSTFNENDDCIDYFTSIKSTEEANKWILNCYLTVVNQYMHSTNETMDENSDRFYIKSAEIQIIDYKMKDCNQTLNISKINFSKCMSSDRITITERKPYLLNNFNINITEGFNLTASLNYNVYDYLLFNSVNLVNPSIIYINNIERDIVNLNNLLTTSYIINANSLDFDYSYLFTTVTQSKISDLLISISQKVDPLSSYDIVDYNTAAMNIVTYFLSVKEKDKDQFLGIVVFRYVKNANGLILCTYNHYSEIINNYYNSGCFSNPELVSFITIFGMIACLYLKYTYLQSIHKTSLISIFFFVFLVILILEYYYKINLIFKSAFNYTSIEDIDRLSYDLTIFAIENIKVIKSFGVIIICYHLI